MPNAAKRLRFTLNRALRAGQGLRDLGGESVAQAADQFKHSVVSRARIFGFWAEVCQWKDDPAVKHDPLQSPEGVEYIMSCFARFLGDHEREGLAVARQADRLHKRWMRERQRYEPWTPELAEVRARIRRNLEVDAGLAREIDEVVAKLPPRDQDVFRRWVKGYSPQRIREELGLASERAVPTIIRRCIKALRDHLGEDFCI